MNWPGATDRPRVRPTRSCRSTARRARQRRRGRDEDEQEHQRRQPDERPEGEARPDADGHIDVLA